MCPARSDFLPKRLIDVSPLRARKAPQLIETTKTDGNAPPAYVCLSHCWGQSIPLKLTAATLEQLKQAVPLADLSKTLQHAIDIPTRLGIDYIWIDSLCILQDSKHDWEQEAAQMGAIYEGCLLVIAATASFDGSGGCYRDVAINVSTPFECSRSFPTGEVITVASRRAVRHPHVRKDSSGRWTSGAPLVDRAWCYQEFQLGPRVLHFTSEELVWECSAAVVCQCGVGVGTALERKSPITRSHNARSDTVLFSQWRQAVTDYSARSLTYESDRLIALAGVAKLFQRYFSATIAGGNRYLAGLWEGDILNGLAWSVGNREMRQAPSLSSRIPSWSWASAQGDVRHSLEIDTDLPKARLLHAECLPSGHDPMGSIASGTITLFGQLIQVQLECDGAIEETPQPGLRRQKYFVTCEGHPDRRPVHYDQSIVGSGQHHTEALSCLLLGYVRGSKENATALILRPALEMSKCYRRVGLLRKDYIMKRKSAEGWFDDAPWTEVTIV